MANALAAVRLRHGFRWWELLPWLIGLALFFLMPTHLALGGRVLVMILFALSLDLLLGYAGVVTLGHAAFFGIGAYAAGILAARGYPDPLFAMAAATFIGALAGAATGAVILRTRALAFLMLTLGVLMVVQEAANRAAWLTGGADGLPGVAFTPLFGLFRFDIFGRTGYLLALGTLLAATLFVRALVHSPFGQSLKGIRENPRRMEAIGAPVQARLRIVFAISAGLAALAGALNAIVTQQVSLNVLSFDLSGAVLVMVILGSHGRLYGAFVGATIYMVAEDALAQVDPALWPLWMGLILIAIVMFGRGGILAIAEDLWRSRRSARS
jgi:branched-chain amino acid transport system permease protein